MPCVDLTYEDAMKMLWYSVILFLFFCLESMLRKDIWMRVTSGTVVVIFRKCHPESFLIAAIIKVRFQQLRDISTAAF